MKRLDDKAWKGIIILILVMGITAILARSMKGSETLKQYAENHPDEQVTAEILPIEEEGSTSGAEAAAVAGEKQAEATAGENEKQTEAAAGADDNQADEVTSGNADSAGADGEDEFAGTDDRIIYQEGFYYEPVPENVRARMRGLSYPDNIDESRVSFDSLRYVRLKYVDFEGNTAEGEMVCNISIAQDVVEIFYELYQAEYRIESIKLIDEFGADDTASMAANNTSCFCYRVVDGSTNLSNHAYGKAIDLNPFYNPYIVFKNGEDDYISPPGSEVYADRSQSFPYKIDENDLAYRLFKEHGFRWGGDWNSCKDYQHFDKKN